MNSARLARMLAELERRERKAGFAPENVCFGPQLGAVKSTHRRKVLRCGRRAGKTYGIVVAALSAASAGKSVLYVTLTRSNAKEIAWPDLLRLNDEFNLGGVVNLTDLSMRFPESGGVVQLRGANNERETAKIRGKKFHLAFIDEAQSIPDRILRPLISEILTPTLLDYSGELWLVGTPPPVRAGYFWECYAGKHADKWEQHHWTLADNERFPALLAGKTVEQIEAEIREENGWSPTDPTFLREIKGQDVEDLEILLFQFSADVNTFTTQPDGQWTYVFGVDIGSDDSDAIAVLGYRNHDPRLYLVDEHVESGQDVTDLAKAIHKRIPIYRPVAIAIDQGGGGKKTAEELRRRHQIPLIPAEKHEKPGYIRLLNADLRKGLLLARPDSRYAEDCKLVQKDPEALLQGILQEKPRKKGGYHSDITDAVLYGWRCARNYYAKPAPKKPSNEAERMSEHHRRLAEQMEAAKRMPWWQRDSRKAGLRR